MFSNFPWGTNRGGYGTVIEKLCTSLLAYVKA